MQVPKTRRRRQISKGRTARTKAAARARSNFGLAQLVQQQFELDPFTNTLFLFCGRRRDRIKGLYWEKDGFILLYKRLEQGAYQWPRSESEVKTLTPQQYRWLMEGLQIEQPKAHRPVTGLTTA